MFSGKKIRDTQLCDNCFKQRPRFLSVNPQKLTGNQFLECHKYISDRRKLADSIIPSAVIAGDANIIVLDTKNGLLAIIDTNCVFGSKPSYNSTSIVDSLKNVIEKFDSNSAQAKYLMQKEIDKRLPGIANDFLERRRKASDYNPSVFRTSEILRYSTQIKKIENEIHIEAYEEDRETGVIYTSAIYSFKPRCFAITYEFWVDIILKNPFESQVRLSLNDTRFYLYKEQEDTIYEPKRKAYFKSLKSYAPYNGKRDNDDIVKNSEIYIRYANYLDTLNNFFIEVTSKQKQYCPMCGSILTGDKIFCPQCGTKIS